MLVQFGSAFHKCFCNLLIAFVLVSFSTLGASAKDPEGEADRDHPIEREAWFLKGRQYQGKVAPQLLQRAQQQRDTLRHQAIFRAQVRSAVTLSSGTSTAAWTELGPAPMNSVASSGDNQDYGFVTGRATSVVVDQNDLTGNTVYVGGAYGGVWKSTNAVNSDITRIVWKPIIDDQPTIAVGAIAVQPGNSNVLLVGTGEANSSADSYYGLGILRSTDGGNSWSLITSANNGLRSFQGLAFAKIAFSSDNPSLVIAATAAASEGTLVGAENPPNTPANCSNSSITATCRGLYYSLDGGFTWNQSIMVDPGSTPPDNGSASSVVYNSQQHKFYAASRAHGFYVSSDGITFTRMGGDPFGFSQPTSGLNTTACPTSPTNLTTCPLYRGEIAVVPGRDEMYVWFVSSASTPVNGGIYQTKDGGKTWASLSVTGIANCGDTSGCDTQQGAYNLALAAIPNGTTATDLYAGAINIYRCRINSNNPTCTTNPFVNLTHVYGCTPTGSFSKVHPDQHAFDFLQSNPNVIFFANDGGIYRTLSALSANSVPAACPANAPANPFYPFDNLNGTMGSMTQFVWFSQHPSDQYTLFGGTQDNGSPAIDSTNSGANGMTWRSVQGGDGGYNDIDPGNGTDWYAAFPRVQITHCSLGTSCTDSQFSTVVSSNKVGGDSAAFYMPYLLDPQNSSQIILGTCRVWRISSTGANPIALSQKFDGSSSSSACAQGSTGIVSALAAGGPSTANGSQVIYAGTDNGRVFATTSAAATTSTWTAISSLGGFSNPNNYPISGIALDLRDSTGNTAYVTVMGFRTSHVWRTADAGATWTDITGDLPDSPANGAVVDKNTGTIYVGTDVGVFSTAFPNGTSTSWNEVGPATGAGALPNVAVTRIAIFAPSGQSPRLRVSTYGRGIWETPIPSSSSADYSLVISNPSLLTWPDHAVTFNGTLTAFNGFTGSVTLSCDSLNGGAVPATCLPSPASTNLTSTTAFTVSASNSATANYSFQITGNSQGSNALTRQATVSLRVIDFAMSVPTPSSIANLSRGDSKNVQVTLTPLGSFDQQVVFSCPAAPSGWYCSPAPTQLTSGGTAQAVITIATDPNTPVGTYTFPLVASWIASGGDVRTQSQSISIGLVNGPGISLNSPVFSNSPVKITQPLTSTITISQRNGYTGTATLSCAGSISSGIAPSACSFTPSTISLGSTPVTSTLTVATTSGLPGSGSIMVQATDGVQTTTANLPFTLTDYSLANVTQPNDVRGAGTVSYSFQVVPSSGYTGTVAFACDTTAFNVAVPCAFSPSSASVIAGSAVSVNATMASPSTVAPGTYTVTLKSNDAVITTLARNVVLGSFKVDAPADYSLNFGSADSAMVKAGGTTTANLTVAATGSFSSSIAFTIAGCPQNATCSISPNPAAPTSSTPVAATLTVTTKAPSISQVRPPRSRNLFALWIGLSFSAVGLVFVRRKRANAALLVLAVAISLGMSACGGGGGGGNTTTPVPTPGTPAGTYTIVVTGTASTTVKSANFTLTVQ